jgi:phenylalanine-4-hydroxylase
MSLTRERIPAHLRQHVVEQDYAAYDEIDQAVWRFVLLQTYGRLQHSAHPVYAHGLAETGISVERIPRIQEMDACLSRHGWGAVCVDGFIPPRAFQEFQALGIMTIAADIRIPEHLAYTPSPDIIHESAGHAPILPDPAYRAYLERFGEVGARAFAAPRDARLDGAIRELSSLKEDARSSPEQIARAESAVREARDAAGPPSEAVLLSRLHWWTVEYGLVGSPEDYRIYGAGLLSSLGESHFCHEPSVRKLPLSRACVDVGYDITRPQPQLYVAESFEQLSEILEETAADLAQRRGGPAALEAALASGELATVELNSGIQISGVLGHVRQACGAPALLEFSGPCALAAGGRILPDEGPDAHPGGYVCPIGPLVDGRDPSTLSDRDLRAAAAPGETDRVELRFRAGPRVRGRVIGSVRASDGALQLLRLADASLEHRDARQRVDAKRCALALGASVRRAFAGPADPRYWPPTDFPTTRAPLARRKARAGDGRLALYRDALRLWEAPASPELVSGFTRIADALRRDFPHEWLLRWNLLECLQKTDQGVVLACRLRDELLEIEERFPREVPISMGLRHLGFEPATRAGEN